MDLPTLYSRWLCKEDRKHILIVLHITRRLIYAYCINCEVVDSETHESFQKLIPLMEKDGQRY